MDTWHSVRGVRLRRARTGGAVRAQRLALSAYPHAPQAGWGRKSR